METSSPVRGLRQMPVLRGRTLKTPKPRSSMRWPFSRARFMASKTVSTASSALDLLMPVRVTTWLTMSSLIKPFVESQVRDGVISYGLSSYGYDVRVADEHKIFTNVYTAVVDPKQFDPRSFVEYKGGVLVIPPNSFALARSVEYFSIPRNVLTICMGKSTYARCGIIVNVTPFEPEWEGFVTLEISNTSPLPARVYSNEGICQVVFLEADEVCEVSYKDKKGKYQAQQGIVLPRI